MLIVKKFGGTSVGNKERILNVAKRCIEDYQKGNDVVVVLSAMGKSTDELIDMANAESDAFSEFVNEDEDSLVDGVDWLKMAVTARTKKYGDNIPVEQKEKAKQLRFLQYRGFKSDICFEALNYTLDSLDERF